MLKKLFGRKSEPPPEPKITPVLCATSHGPEYFAFDEEMKHNIEHSGQHIYNAPNHLILVAYHNEMGDQEIGYLSGEQAKTWMAHPPSDKRGKNRLRFIRHCMLQGR